MTRYQVDSEAVVAATAGAQATMSRIEGEVAGLLSQLVNLESSWTGQAAASFQSAVGDWRATQQRVHESMGLINRALAQAGQTYAETEAGNARLFLH
ncbi:MAG TPA: WXG100 family type VII secretion target [Pseudolysinimonas sp.]|nr:WXG100 family type VII secretion target [Pseudolysinimonas sp.]